MKKPVSDQNLLPSEMKLFYTGMLRNLLAN